ncbi:MAG TPA: preprotein translocase subunit YajC [Planctomycetes bacterium]|nr:preprotein translocase subunit YajC [Planctomycetota bacterium]
MFTGFLWIGLLLAFLWLVVIRPENKRQKEMKNIRENLKKGDRVVTSGGIHGQIARMDEETISIKVDEKVRLKIDRNAVARVEQAKQEN